MRFDIWVALGTGLVAGVAMAIPVVGARVVGLPIRLDMLRIWGGYRSGPAPVVALGAVIHLALSMAIGLLYAAGLTAIGDNGTALGWGLVGGAIHWLIAGAAIGPLAAAHPQVPGRMPAPGPYCLRLGASDAVVFLVAHLAFGVACAGVYTGVID